MQQKHTMNDLYQMQGMSLKNKIEMTKRRIVEWVDEYGLDGVYVSFSGGKDSTVLLHLAREIYPQIKGTFYDTGLEYPEIRNFVKTFDNIDWVKPEMNFKQVVENYGYPFFSKEVSECVYAARKYLKSINNSSAPTNAQDGQEQFKWYADCYKRVTGTHEYKKRNEGDELSPEEKEYLEKLPPCRRNRSMYSCVRYSFLLDAPFEIHKKCCYVMKKSPAHKYQKRTGRNPITAQMASESRLRAMHLLKFGCNGFDAKNRMSNPMSFWTEQDVLLYIWKNKIPIASVYGDIVVDHKANGDVNGQMSLWNLCEDLELLDTDRPTLTTTGYKRTGCMFCAYGCHLEKPGKGRFEMMKVTHPKQYDYIMRPKEQGGLNYKEIIDWINEHGHFCIKY